MLPKTKFSLNKLTYENERLVINISTQRGEKIKLTLTDGVTEFDSAYTSVRYDVHLTPDKQYVIYDKTMRKITVDDGVKEILSTKINAVLSSVDTPVYAFIPELDNVYLDAVPFNQCYINDDDTFTTHRPTNGLSKWKNKQWEPVVVVIYDDGHYMRYPTSVCDKCKKFFTATEWDTQDHVPQSGYEVYDFETETWFDSRSLKELKNEAKLLKQKMPVYDREINSAMQIIASSVGAILSMEIHAYMKGTMVLKDTLMLKDYLSKINMTAADFKQSDTAKEIERIFEETLDCLAENTQVFREIDQLDTKEEVRSYIDDVEA